MQAATTDCWDAQRWGLGPAVIDHLTDALRTVWQRYQPCFHTRTHDSSAKAWVYLRGVLTMDDHRTFANISRRVQGGAADGQEVQQFVSDARLSGAGGHSPASRPNGPQLLNYNTARPSVQGPRDYRAVEYN